MPRQVSPRQTSLPLSPAAQPPVAASDSRPGRLGRPLTAVDVLTAREVADLLHVPRSTVEDWARRGVIPSRKVGRRRLYLRPSIETLLLDRRS
jgi:excisionase family DNA binding protein